MAAVDMQRGSDTDLLIIGGGPAGSAAAITARRAGLSVVVLDRSRFPRDRPGETLHPGIEPLLTCLGAREPILDANYLRPRGHWVEWNGPPKFAPFGEDSAGPWYGFQAPRAHFDQELLFATTRNGATVHLERPALSVRIAHNRVTGVNTPQGPIEARFTVDCTGGSHWLARQLGISVDRHSPPLIARFGYAVGPISPQRIPCIRADSVGWTWISEVERGRFHWTRVTCAHDRPPHEWLPAELENASRGRSGGADVTWRLASRTAGPGWFLAGDAAAVLDPSSSHGVLRAIMTGMMAGHLIAQAIRCQALEAECADAYLAWLSMSFERDATRMRDSYRSARLFRCGAFGRLPAFALTR